MQQIESGFKDPLTYALSKKGIADFKILTDKLGFFSVLDSKILLKPLASSRL